jgi:two-component system sensor histidine kinase RegB
LVQTLGSLVKNAFDACESKDARVHLEVESRGATVRFTIVDEGAGMTSEELSRVGEPFFTTKEPGSGMGLGVFLARAFVDQLGGALTFDSVRGKGTRAIVEIPVKEI